MFIRWILPILAALGFIVAVRIVIISSKPVLPQPPPSQPSVSPYPSFVAGTGIVESSTENIAVSSHLSGVVSEVFVKAGDTVKAGDVLFKIDDRQELAKLAVDEAGLQVAEASLADARAQLELWGAIEDKRALSKDELNRKRYAVQIANAQVEQAKATIYSTKTTLERQSVKAPVDGTVLQVKIRKGEFAQAGLAETPIMIIGSTAPLHLRVDVDENDAWRVKPSANAEAFLRGNRDIHSSLEFVRFEPYVIPKRSLTGESTERVDTRVLQVIYKITDVKLAVFVGQLMDVYIEADKH